LEFGSSSEEASYWREKFEQLAKESQETKEEFEEFQEGSRELEAELEAQLEQSEFRIKEYRSLSNRLQLENDQLKSKLEQCHREYHFQISELQTELNEIRSIKEDLNRYVRELEQQNDDLERAKRSTLASLEDFETKMNAMIERNAFLESELDEKESLKAAVQRLKDETRDLRSELRVVTAPNKRVAAPAEDVVMVDASTAKTPDNDKSFRYTFGRKRAERNNNNVDSNRLGPPPEGAAAGATAPPLTPSARLSALNIVGDLLRKVGALEIKLSSCRNMVHVKEHQGQSLSQGASPAAGCGGGKGQLNRSLSPSASNLSSLNSKQKQQQASMIPTRQQVVDMGCLPRTGSSPTFKKMANGSKG